MSTDVIFYQLFDHESSTYTYLVADKNSKEAAIIDPVKEKFNRDALLIQEQGLKLIYILETHVHADHITGADLLRGKFGAKTGVAKAAGISCADLELTDGQELLIGALKIKVIATPGHTHSCLSYYLKGRVFTGDALLIRGCGRTDFQQGSSLQLYESVTQKLFKLLPETLVYPAHDYNGQTSSTIEMEIKYNPRLGSGRSREDFVTIMSDLKLAQPKKIHEAVPANLVCGKSL